MAVDYRSWHWQVYSNGASEIILGKAIKQLNLPREEIVVLTKVRYDNTSSTPAVCTKSLGNTQLHFPISRNPGERLWGAQDSDGLGYVNQYGQSRKHIFDAVQQSLKRLQLDYIDVLQCSLPFSFYSPACTVGNRRSLASLMPHFFFLPQAIVLTIMPLSRKWCVLDGIASNCGSIAVIAHNTPHPSFSPALADASASRRCPEGLGPLHWHEFMLGLPMYAPSLQPAHPSALLSLLPANQSIRCRVSATLSSLTS
jgi:Aldo/keto reductase family